VSEPARKQASKPTSKQRNKRKQIKKLTNKQIHKQTNKQENKQDCTLHVWFQSLTRLLWFCSLHALLVNVTRVIDLQLLIADVACDAHSTDTTVCKHALQKSNV
jgi:hypothetical protein